MYIYHCFISLSKPTSVSVSTSKCSNITVCNKFWLFRVAFEWLWMVVYGCGCFWMVVGGCCGWLQVFAYFSITHNGIHFNKISIFGQHCIGQWNGIFSLGLFHLWSLLSSTMKKTPKVLRSCFRKKNIILYNIFLTK